MCVDVTSSPGSAHGGRLARVVPVIIQVSKSGERIRSTILVRSFQRDSHSRHLSHRLARSRDHLGGIGPGRPTPSGVEGGQLQGRQPSRIGVEDAFGTTCAIFYLQSHRRLLWALYSKRWQYKSSRAWSENDIHLDTHEP